MVLAVVAALTLTTCSSDLIQSHKRDSVDCPECPQCPEPGPARIAVLGDRTGHPDDDVFFGIIKEIMRLRPDMIISIGDLIEGYQPDDRIGEAEDEWNELMPRIRRLIGDTPFYVTAGNHDVWSEQSEALFTKNMNHPVNFSMDVGSCKVILFDTSRYNSETEINEDDLEWLSRALFAARDKKERIVITHRPLWAQKPGGEYGSPLHDVLIAGNADTVISGHWHHAMSDDRDSIQYRMMGPSGASLNSPDHPETGNIQQFGLLVVDSGGATFSLVRAGAVMEGSRFPYHLNQLEWQLENRAVKPQKLDLSASNPVAFGVFYLDVTNVTDEKLDAVLSVGGGNWIVTPKTRDLELRPKEARQMRFSYRLKNRSVFFPGPLIEMDFPWFEKGEYHLRKHLDPTLTHPVMRATADPGPLVDGDLSDPTWRRVSVLRRFYDFEDGPMPEMELRVLLVENVLYFGAEMTEPEMKGQVVSSQGRDGFLEDEDHLVLWLDGDPEARGYSRIAVNAAGVVSDRSVGIAETTDAAMAWNGVREAAAKQGEESWTLELAVPLEALGWKGSRRIGFNVARGRKREGLSIAHWQPLLEHDDDSFGALLLPK